jgi:hypothetical protein
MVSRADSSEGSAKEKRCQDSFVADQTKTIAVGTAVASGPPHRSVREYLPHTAPPSGRTIAKTPLPVVIIMPLQVMLDSALSPKHRWQVGETSLR